MNVTAEPSRVRTRTRITSSASVTDVFPPITLGTSGEPISVVDAVVSAVLIALTLDAIRRVTGADPTNLL